MAFIGGPPKPGGPGGKDPARGVGGASSVETPPPAKAAPAPPKAVEPAVDAAAAFESTPGGTSRDDARHLAEGEAPRASSVNARLQAFQGTPSPGAASAGGASPASKGPLIKTATTSGVQIVETEAGKIARGAVRVESPRGLEKLEGVVRIEGDFALAESLAKSVHMNHLRALREVAGRFTVEGNAGLQMLQALEQLRLVGGTVYVGFNDTLASVTLPELRQVDGAFIVEANGALKQLQLPQLALVGRYLHVQENPLLQVLDAPRLTQASEFVLDTAVKQLRVGQRDAPLVVQRLDVPAGCPGHFALLG